MGRLDEARAVAEHMRALNLTVWRAARDTGTRSTASNTY